MEDPYHPAKKFMKVVFPEPEGPSIAVIEPYFILVVIPFKITLCCICFHPSSFLIHSSTQTIKFSTRNQKPSKFNFDF